MAGAVSGYLLARLGLSVLLVEAKPFPRPKVCGGCLNDRALSTLDGIGLGDAVDIIGGRPFDSVQLLLGRRRVRLSVPPGVAVTREPLDAEIVARAQQAGAAFLPNTTARVLREPAGETRTVRLGDDQHAYAKVVLACDGLSRPSLATHPDFQSHQREDSRVGIGAVVDASSLGQLALGDSLAMVVGRGGYVGFSSCEEHKVSIAAAVDRSVLRGAASPYDAVAGLIAQSGVTIDEALRTTLWRGTRPLSQISRRVAGHRVLLLGDAAGYVEPFTGEGMAAAVESACLAAPLVALACKNWDQTIATDWQSLYTTRIRTKQRACARLAWLLRHPQLAGWVLGAVAAWPRLGESTARRISARRTQGHE